MSPPSDVMLVPYGVDTWPVGAISVRHLEDGSVQLYAPFPCGVINKAASKLLRLNSEVLDPAAHVGAPQSVTPLNLVKDRLKGFCRPWDRLSLQFVDGYFEHIARMLEIHRDAIATKLAPFIGLYKAEDWAFSAPKPLPRAHLPAPRSSGDAGWDIEDFVQADFAFWLGDRAVAALSQPEALTPARAKHRLARLERAGVSVVTFNAENLTKDPAALFHRIIGDFGALLGSAGAVPVGPIRPPELGDH